AAQRQRDDRMAEIAGAARDRRGHQDRQAVAQPARPGHRESDANAGRGRGAAVFGARTHRAGGAMAQVARRIGPVAAALALACGGLLHHDVTVSQEFQAGGGAPTAVGQIQSSALTAPLAAAAGDLQKLSSVTLQSLKLESTDSGDLSYVAGGTLSI